MVDGDLKRLFIHPEPRRAFVDMDVTYLRAQYWIYGEETSKPLEQKGFGHFVCEAVNEDGTTCDKVFTSYRASGTHTFIHTYIHT